MKNKTLVTLGILGGLVALGGLAYTYIRKPKKNKDGFYNASGTSKSIPHRRCYCMTPSPKNQIYLSETESCNLGDRCVALTGVY